MTHQTMRVLPSLCAVLLLFSGCGGGGGAGSRPTPPPSPSGPPAPAPQTIAFANVDPIAHTYGDAAFTSVASGGAGTGAISYVSGTPAVATVDAATGLVTIVSA